MNTTELVFIIILSVSLTIFLILFSVALGFFIAILRQVKRITERAENVADTVESAANTFERVASPLAVLKLIGGIIENATKFKRRKG